LGSRDNIKGQLSKGSPLLKKSLKDYSVLLVEDNDINRLYASSILKIWDCKIDIAENGFVAVEKIKNGDYDIVLMDVQMPVMDGFEATKAIRASAPPKSQIPIIALTANATRKDIEQCLASGMNDCIPKPFTPEDLYNKLVRFKSGSKKSHQRKASTLKKIVDLTYLRTISNNNQKFIDEMITAFLESIPKSIQEIKMNVQTAEWAALARAVHKIKPSLTLIGLHSSKEKALLLEDFAKQQKNLDKIPSLVNDLCDELSDAMRELRRMSS
jgi:CheY-like chemotaxis protein